MRKSISIIVSRCKEISGEPGKDFRLYGDRLVDEVFEDDLAESQRVLLSSDKHRAKGKVVIVRPNYNEKNPDGTSFFREWRSFDGEPFKECRWEAGF